MAENDEETEEAKNQCDLQLQLHFALFRNGKPPQQRPQLCCPSRQAQPENGKCKAF